MRKFRGAVAGALLFFTALPLQAQERRQPVVATDLFKIHQLGSVAVSPDGRYAAYTVKTVQQADSARAYTYRTHLYLVPTNGSDPARPLTRGEAGASQPAWHPGGDQLAFVRTVEEKPQIFILPLAGGEAYQLTHFEQGASAPRWSDDGERLLFSASLPEEAVRALEKTGPRWPSERPGRTPEDGGDAEANPDGSLANIRAWLDGNSLDDNPRTFNRLNLQDELDLAAHPTYRHLFVIDVKEGARPAAVTRGFYSFEGGAWLPGGQQIVASAAPVDDAHPDRVRDSDLFLFDVDSGRRSLLLDLEGYALHDPRLTPDGRHVAFIASDLSDPGYAQPELGLFSLDGRTAPELITLHFDRSVNDFRWSDDGWYLYFTAASEGGFPLYRMPAFEGKPALPSEALGVLNPAAALGGLANDSLARSKARYRLSELQLRPPTVERLTDATTGVGSFDVGRATVVYVLTRAENPYELYASNLEFNRTNRLTSHNQEWLRQKQLSLPEPFVLQRDTLAIPYWIMKPAFFEPERTYPLLVEMHGGPSAMWGPGEATMWFEFQFLAARGYGIVYSNPRGSGGYGYAFQHANYQDWGTGPAGDVLAVATEAARQPWVDSTRQVLTGGSYAGYLTAWIVGHDDRFKAAVAQRGVYDLGTFLGEGNAWRLIPDHFGGFPWEEAPGLPAPPTQVSLMPRLKALQDSLAAAALAADADTTLADTALLATEPTDTTEAALPEEEAEAEAAPEDTTLAQAIEAALIDSAMTGAGMVDSTLADSTVADSSAVDTTMAEEIDVAADSAAAPPLMMRELLALSSPLTFVDRIHTPLLIIHGDNDLRTGVVQSEMLYKSLKILERPVEYIRYPKAGHDLSRTGDPKQRLDRILRIYEFLARYVGDEAPPPPEEAEADVPADGPEAAAAPDTTALENEPLAPADSLAAPSDDLY